MAPPPRDHGGRSAGDCAGHNLAKEDEGHQVCVVSDGFGAEPHEIAWRTPTARVVTSVAPPVLGWGTAPTGEAAERDQAVQSPLEAAFELLLGAA